MAHHTSSSIIGRALAGGATSISIPLPLSSSSSNNKHDASSSATRHHLIPPTPTTTATHPSDEHDTDIDAHPSLLTPPNSMPEHQLRSLALASSASDEHLHDNESHDVDADATASLLAREYLPSLLLDQGAVSVRDLLTALCDRLPHFAALPPPKQRRMVSTALGEHRPDGGRGGPNRDVLFEKVGWGKWTARLVSESDNPPKHTHRKQSAQLTSPALLPHDKAIRISKHARPKTSSRHKSQHSFRAVITPSPDLLPTQFNMDLDKMNLDDAYPVSDSDNEPEHLTLEDIDSGSETDSEDWEAIGAEALRRGSIATSHKNNANGKIITSYSTSWKPHSHASSYRTANALPIKNTTPYSRHASRDGRERERASLSSSYKHSLGKSAPLHSPLLRPQNSSQRTTFLRTGGGASEEFSLRVPSAAPVFSKVMEWQEGVRSSATNGASTNSSGVKKEHALGHGLGQGGNDNVKIKGSSSEGESMDMDGDGDVHSVDREAARTLLALGAL